MSKQEGLNMEYIGQSMLLIVIVVVTFVGILLWTKWRNKRRRK